MARATGIKIRAKVGAAQGAFASVLTILLLRAHTHLLWVPVVLGLLPRPMVLLLLRDKDRTQQDLV